MDVLLWSIIIFLVFYGWWIGRGVLLEIGGNVRLTDEEEALRWGKILQELPDEKRMQMKRQIADELAQSRATL